MKIRLIAIDLDGTLLNSKKQVTPDVSNTIREVRRRHPHMQIILSTARPPRSTLPFYRELELRDPMINYNGALIWSPVKGKVLLHKPIPFRIAHAILRWSKEKFPGKVFVSANIGDKWYTDFRDQASNMEAVKKDQPDMVAPYTQWMTQAPTKLMLLGLPQALDAIEKACKKGDLSKEVSLYRAHSKMLQIMQATASKRDALKKLSKYLGIPREEVMAIGDNVNDAGMIHWSGVGVSMANGHVICLQVADHVTDHHDRDGVASVLQHIILEGRDPHGM